MSFNLNPFQKYYEARKECEKIFLQDFENDVIKLTFTLVFIQSLEKSSVTRTIRLGDLDGRKNIEFRWLFDDETSNGTDAFECGLFELKYRDTEEKFQILTVNGENLIFFQSDQKFAKFTQFPTALNIQLNWKDFPATFESLAAEYKVCHRQITMEELSKFK